MYLKALSLILASVLLILMMAPSIPTSDGHGGAGGLGHEGRVMLTITQYAFAEESKIPEWIKNTAGWWAEGQIEDSDFIQSMEFLIKEEIIQVPVTSVTEEKSDTVPDWVRNNAGWWADGLISDDDFISGIKYLVEQGIIKV